MSNITSSIILDIIPEEEKKEKHPSYIRKRFDICGYFRSIERAYNLISKFCRKNKSFMKIQQDDVTFFKKFKVDKSKVYKLEVTKHLRKSNHTYSCEYALLEDGIVLVSLPDYNRPIIEKNHKVVSTKISDFFGCERKECLYDENADSLIQDGIQYSSYFDL